MLSCILCNIVRKYGRKTSRIVKRFGKYRRKLWKDMEKCWEYHWVSCVSEWARKMKCVSVLYSSYFSSVFSISFHYSTYFSSIISISFHYSTQFSSEFSISFHYSTYFSSVLIQKKSHLNSEKKGKKVWENEMFYNVMY
jgi:hypothetical protein